MAAQPWPEEKGNQMGKPEIVHVTGTTPDEINASFNAAKAHYTPAGANAPTKAVTERLRREAKAARDAIGVTAPRSAAHAAQVDAINRASAAKEASKQSGKQSEEDKASDRVDELVAEAKTRTGPSDEDVKAAAAQLQKELESPEFAEAMENIDEILAEQAETPAEDAEIIDLHAARPMTGPADEMPADDPFSKVLGIRKACNNKRGPGTKLTTDELVAQVKAYRAKFPQYSAWQIQETLYWVDGFKVSHRTMDRAWETITGSVPVRGRKAQAS